MPNTSRSITLPATAATWTSSGSYVNGKDISAGLIGTFYVSSDLCNMADAYLRKEVKLYGEWVSTTKLYEANGSLVCENVNRVVTESIPTSLSKVQMTLPFLAVTPTSVTINQNLRLKPTETIITIALKDFGINNMIELSYSGSLSLGYMKIDNQQLPSSKIVSITSDNQTSTGILTIHNDTAGIGNGYLVITAKYA